MSRTPYYTVVNHERLRATFDQDAERYDRARPEYPTELMANLVTLAGIRTGSRVLEVGAGTGKATIPLADRGCEIEAIELGSNMAAVARRNLARFPAVTVVVSAFEDWPLPADPFDVVICATAWHWIDPRVRVSKAVRALRAGGCLALISTHHIAGGDEEFFREVQECYELWDPATQPGLRLPTVDEIAATTGELQAPGRFGPSITRRYQRDIPYSTQEYLDVLLTYSHRALESRRREGLLDCIARLIDGRYGGRITKRYLFHLEVVRRLAD